MARTTPLVTWQNSSSGTARHSELIRPPCCSPRFPPTGDLVAVPSVPIPGRSEYRLSLGLTPRLRADVQCFGPNIVHVTAPDPLGYQAQGLDRRLNLPVVASLHTRFETYLDYYGYWHAA